MSAYKRIVVLTGAGVSAESGISTFRDNNGLWCNHRIEDVATPEAFIRNPALVHEFYNLRRRQLTEVKPNAAHHALADFATRYDGAFMLVTQNVDDLHDRAMEGRVAKDGYTLLHMHGELNKIRCDISEEIIDWTDNLSTEHSCQCCGKKGYLRPHIVWFGEMPLYMERIYAALSHCDLFISIGTSGNVYPAAGFVQEARLHGAHTVELNLEPSLGESLFAEKIYGKASEVVPEYLKKLL